MGADLSACCRESRGLVACIGGRIAVHRVLGMDDQDAGLRAVGQCLAPDRQGAGGPGGLVFEVPGGAGRGVVRFSCPQRARRRPTGAGWLTRHSERRDAGHTPWTSAANDRARSLTPERGEGQAENPPGRSTAGPLQGAAGTELYWTLAAIFLTMSAIIMRGTNTHEAAIQSLIDPAHDVCTGHSSAGRFRCRTVGCPGGGARRAHPGADQQAAGRRRNDPQGRESGACDQEFLRAGQSELHARDRQGRRRR